jgi:hypothetical protein
MYSGAAYPIVPFTCIKSTLSAYIRSSSAAFAGLEKLDLCS